MTRNKYLGCIYGLAIGDALGFPNEFKNLETILQRNNGLGTTDFTAFSSEIPSGSYTDDTQMTLAIANSLLKSDLEQYNINEIMDNIKDEFLKWLDDPENNRAPGRTCLKGCRWMKRGLSWKESGDTNSKGCGSAMRTAPIGLVFYDDTTKLIETATASSICTHAHPTAISAAIGTAYLTSLALQGVNHNEWIKKLLDLNCLNKEFKDKIAQITDVLNHENHFTALEKLGEGWIGEEAVALALYCVLKNPNDYQKTVLMGANTAGDSDSIACIAGAISGAYNGIEKIPEKWIKRIEKTEYLKDIALRLHDISPQPLQSVV